MSSQTITPAAPIFLDAYDTPARRSKRERLRLSADGVSLHAKFMWSMTALRVRQSRRQDFFQRRKHEPHLDARSCAITENLEGARLESKQGCGDQLGMSSHADAAAPSITGTAHQRGHERPRINTCHSPRLVWHRPTSTSSRVQHFPSSWTLPRAPDVGGLQGASARKCNPASRDPEQFPPHPQCRQDASRRYRVSEAFVF